MIVLSTLDDVTSFLLLLNIKNNNLTLYIFQLLSSPLCNRQGTFECGQCTCDPGRYGKKCECDGSQSTSDESLKKCIKYVKSDIA